MYVILDKRLFGRKTGDKNFHISSQSGTLVYWKQMGVSTEEASVQPNREPQAFIWFSWSGLTF